MKTKFTLKEVARRHDICLYCEAHMVVCTDGFNFYCTKHKTDSIVYLVDRCKKLAELKSDGTDGI